MANIRKELDFAFRDAADPEVILTVGGIESGRWNDPASFSRRLDSALRGLTIDPKTVTDNIARSKAHHVWRR